VAIHPPWWQGNVGTHAVEYPITLPEKGPLELQFANAMSPPGQSDGVTFRVRALPLDAPDGELGEVLFERHTDTKMWRSAEVDLTRFAGQSIRLQLESHPGPRNNTGWDQSFWAEPMLVAGNPQSATESVVSHDLLSPLGEITVGGCSYQVKYSMGDRGLLDATVEISDGTHSARFHGFHIRVLGCRVDEQNSPLRLTRTIAEPADSGVQIRHQFESHLGSFDLVIHLRIERHTLRASFSLENEPEPQPWQVVYLEDIAVGPWNDEISHVYAGVGNVIRKPGDFLLRFDGHRLATSMIGLDLSGGISLLQASDLPPISLSVRTSEKHASLHTEHNATLTFVPSDNVFEAAKHWRNVNGLTASEGVPKVAGRFAFDLWSGRYGASAEALRRAFRYGLTDSLVVWHQWQRWGYDYRLPNIVPPNPQLGTIDEMRDLMAACREAGVLFALHDNYIDFYPDADGFSYEEVVAFHQDGRPVEAWFNKWRDARSYRYRSDQAERFLKPNIEWLCSEMPPSAYFIDVWSSVRPYDYWTADGQFHTAVESRQIWGELFAWIRDRLGADAPQISESGHDQLIGWLDGAQTNHLRVGEPVPGDNSWCVWNWKCEDAERTPWFDAAHHDRFILHGAGYGSRYAGGLDNRLHGIYSDDYMSTEVLTGHPAMVSQPFGRDVVRKYWLLAELQRALALRNIERVEYVDGDLHRQHVKWSGGADVYVNRGESNWRIENRVLPQFGFLARVQTDRGSVEASLELRDGQIVEMATSPDHIYVNGRQLTQKRLPIGMSVDGIKHEGGRRFSLELSWAAEVPIPAGWTPFLHFCRPDGQIAFQAHHSPPAFESDTQGRFVARAAGEIPQDVETAEAFELCFGIYHRATGTRLELAGPDTGDRRIRVGHIHPEFSDGNITGVAWKPYVPVADPFLARWNVNDNPVNFGPIKTAAGCRICREAEALFVIPLPSNHRDTSFSAVLDWRKLPWPMAPPKVVELIDETGNVISRREIETSETPIELSSGVPVFAYRVK
jgi:hypothetical protein